MWLADSWKDYEVLDTSAGEKLERWGKYILVRPDPQVIWNTPKDDPLWRKYDARYARSNTGGGKWQNLRLPAQWQVHYKELTFESGAEMTISSPRTLLASASNVTPR